MNSCCVVCCMCRQLASSATLLHNTPALVHVSPTRFVSHNTTHYYCFGACVANSPTHQVAQNQDFSLPCLKEEMVVVKLWMGRLLDPKPRPLCVFWVGSIHCCYPYTLLSADPPMSSRSVFDLVLCVSPQFYPMLLFFFSRVD